MARRIQNRKELRADYDAAERQQGEEVEEEVEEEEDEDAEDDEEAEGDEEPGDEDDDEDAPKKKKKKVVVKVVKPKRTRVAKVIRMRVVWGVFNNSNQRVAVYDYPKRHEADEHATRLTTEKKNTHFVQPVKEPIEEKKEEPRTQESWRKKSKKREMTSLARDLNSGFSRDANGEPRQPKSTKFPSRPLGVYPACTTDFSRSMASIILTL